MSESNGEQAGARREAVARHADHEMSQFLRLHIEMRSERFGGLDEHVRRAIYVAYATHVRALLEFFHEGDKKGSNVHARRFSVHELSADEVAAWDNQASERWREATRLASHVSGERPNLTGARAFGGVEDFDLVGCRILALLEATEDAAESLPLTIDASRELRRRLPLEAARCP